MGQRDAPDADAMTGLYFALNDMDAQVANVLLVGGGTALAANQTRDIKTHASDRTAADRDLEQATVSEAGNESAERELALVLDRMGQYEALAADALLAGTQARSAVGQAPATAIAYYQQATGLMQSGILPAVGSLTTVAAASLDAAYQDGETASGTGTAWLAALGGLLAVVLLALQFHLTVRFRRLVNPALAAATVLAVAFTAVAAARLGAEFRNITFPGERQAAVAALLSFQRYEKDDRTMRALAAKSLAAAVGYDIGTAPGQSDWAFNQYDAALSGVIAVNSRAFTAAVHDGEDGGAGWELIVPGLGFVLVAALTVAGARPRLAEYRP